MTIRSTRAGGSGLRARPKHTVANAYETPTR